MKPLLRWAGSKKQILHYLSKYWANSFDMYIEPFAGSASLFFRILPRKAVLSDLNEELINAYKLVKTTPNKVIEALRKMSNTKEDYYRIRSLNNLSLPEQAARFIYLNSYSFNGLYRTNLKGQFNVPYGGEKSGRVLSDKEIFEISQHLRGVELRCCDFEESVGTAKHGDFVYLDPPYRVNGKASFIEYGPVTFSMEDMGRLERCVKTLISKKIAFLLSYIDSPEGQNLAKDLNITTIAVKRNISGFSSTPKIINELVITNIVNPEKR